ncbi:acetyl-CoA carboxylase biotin carboxyl carrier protein subunit [Rhodococcoides fascians]|uniref:acetyl-CoA carboxylase n=1 Tax=Rhodococcoides fascians TaxID=1828 RepID=UPI000B9A7856|nr:acetyl-CoA carboxylase [Rhodococcus fascians]OZE85348.1 acetyl-CoA carboxylase biotin carboxyl carrier protein subunit [Rhodococcus fascians]OZF11855.1 acetyl-CoA carboxylase biotin carboxyl carrier protein subunit [Rhodococcus fascians]OZF14624.1 acetyl-CoA carboxylase biotin carboxyl carrier protein subunit [Rhodococcus fascians]OZF61201.1 acetyl-CoA carboxylase biotin carboxyl carrier protein subunit [Rhodococcus fascians]OZF64305.1 acetyl-CoA carboxylase biotin carboxyl carrier protein 
MATHEISTPVPGIFYRNPGPGKPPYVSEGDHVDAGQAIGLVEIMKQFSEVKSSVAGVIDKFVVEDAAEVNPGSVIAVLTEDQ